MKRPRVFEIEDNNAPLNTLYIIHAMVYPETYDVLSMTKCVDGDDFYLSPQEVEETDLPSNVLIQFHKEMAGI